MFRFLPLACLTALATLGVASTANAFTVVTPPASDAAFEDLLRSGELQEVFVPGGRGGNNNSGAGGERELEILDPLDVDFSGGYPGTIVSGSQTPVASGQRVWQNDTFNPFSIVYNPSASSTPKLTFTYGAGATANTLTTNNFSFGVTEIFLRTRVSSQNTDGSFTSSLQNLVLNGTAINQTLSSTCTRASSGNCSDVDYLRITGLSGGFTLTGESKFAWTSPNLPSNSRMMFQVKALAPGSRPAPAPGMVAGFALMGAGTLWKKLRSRA